jgi:fermentation-respiration switch protein FrsA (DUF1100 family)
MTTSLRTMLSVATLRRPDFWERSWKHRLGRIAIYLAFVYVVVLVAVLLLEDQFLYGPRRAELSNPPADVQVESIDLTSQRGDRINAWWSKAEDWRPEQGAVLFCHGNAGNLSHRGRVLSRWIKDMGLAVLIFDYPGFGRSSGEPCEEGCYAAGGAAYDWLCQKAKVPAERIVLYGGSLGGGIATELASRRPHWALVLVATFTSIPDMAQARFPWLPARWLARHRYDNLDKIAHCRGPVFIAHSPQDGLIPFWQGERLFAAASEPKFFFPMPNYRHNDLPTAEFYPTLHRFLADCARTAN